MSKFVTITVDGDYRVCINIDKIEAIEEDKGFCTIYLGTIRPSTTNLMPLRFNVNGSLEEVISLLGIEG